MHRESNYPSIKSFLVTSACALLSGCSGCQPQSVAVVRYQQIGACNGLGNLQGAGPNTALVVFFVESIDNTKTGKSFSFRRGRIENGDGDAPNPVATAQYSGALGIPAMPGSISVPSGKNVPVNGNIWFVVGTGDPDGAKEANAVNYFLNYVSEAAGPGVLMTKIDPNRTSWPYTPQCQNIAFRKP